MGRELTVNAAKPKVVKYFVGGLNKEKTTESSLRNYFAPFGEITDCFCVITRGFGFVTLIDDGNNLDGILGKDGHKRHKIDEQMCDVKVAKKKEEMGQQGGRGGRGRGGYGGRGGRGQRNSFGSPSGYGQQYNPYQGGNSYNQNQYQQPPQNQYQQPPQQQQNTWQNFQSPQQNNQYQPQQTNNQYQPQQNKNQYQPQQNNQYQQQNTWQQQPQKGRHTYQ